MTTEQIKNNFHSLIDKVNDIELLNNFYEGLLHCADKTLLKELSEEGKKENFISI